MFKFSNLSFFVVSFGLLFGFTGCQDEGGEGEGTTKTGALKVDLVSNAAQIGATPFDVTILNAEDEVLYEFTHVTAADADKIFSLKPGKYKVAIQSERSDVIHITDNLFSGVSDLFEITTAQTTNISVATHPEPFEQWVRAPDAPFDPRYAPTSFIIDSTIYVGLGANFLNERFQDWWSYSIAENEWVHLQDFPGGKRFMSLGFSVNGKGYVCFGYTDDTGELTEFWEYTPANDSWTRLADFPGDARSAATAFVIDNTIHVGSGLKNDGITSLLDFYAYDRTENQWSAIADFPGDSTYGFTSLTINNTAHLLGGVVDNDVRTKQHFTYNSATGWAQQPDFPGDAQMEGVSFGIGGRGYYGLGSIDNNTPGTELWKFDSENSTWTQVDDFVDQSRFYMTSGSSGYIGYYGFGYYGETSYNDLYLYFPAVEGN